MNDGRRIVAGVVPGACRIRHDRRPQRVVRIAMRPPHAFVHHVLDAQIRVPPDIHADPEKHHDNAGVLADRPVPLRTHPRIGKNLRDGIACGRRLFPLVRLTEGGDVVDRMEIGNVLQRIRDAEDKVLLTDRASHVAVTILTGLHALGGHDEPSSRPRADARLRRSPHSSRRWSWPVADSEATHWAVVRTSARLGPRSTSLTRSGSHAFMLLCALLLIFPLTSFARRRRVRHRVASHSRC